MLFIPTFLYIKQHAITGKLYFGKTSKTEHQLLNSYNGSGHRWMRHIKKHGKDHVITLWYNLYDNVFDLVADALSFSNSLNIKESNSWLNLKHENGLTGGFFFTKEEQEHILKQRSAPDADGISSFQRAARKAAATRNTVKLPNGHTIAQDANCKARQTKSKIGDDGTSIDLVAARKAAITKTTITKSGLSKAQEASIKTVDKRTIVGEDGLTCYQRSWIKAQETKEKSNARDEISRKIVMAKTTLYNFRTPEDEIIYNISTKNFCRGFNLVYGTAIEYFRTGLSYKGYYREPALNQTRAYAE